MEIKDDNEDMKIFQNDSSNLSLRKKKAEPKNNQKSYNNIIQMKSPINELLEGEIILKDEEIIFSNKKRLRESSTPFIAPKDTNIINLEKVQNEINDEEKKLSEKSLEIFKKLQVPHTPGVKEGGYDEKYHSKREIIVKELLSDEMLINCQRKLAIITKNVDIYCTVLDNFLSFCYYDNKFMVDNHEYLVQIVENAFNFEDKSKSVPLALKFSSTVIDFGFYEEYRNKFIELFINICLDKNKMKDINLIPRSKIYLYYIIYLIFKDSWENVHIEQNKLNVYILP